jgi:hypothetical protein
MSSDRLMMNDEFSENDQIPNSIKIRPMGADLFRAHRRKDGSDESNSRVCQFRESA